MQLHGTMTVIVCLDLRVCQCMVFKIYRAMALSLATPGASNRGSAQARPKQALHVTSNIYDYTHFNYYFFVVFPSNFASQYCSILSLLIRK